MNVALNMQTASFCNWEREISFTWCTQVVKA